MKVDAITDKILEEARAQAASTLEDAGERVAQLRAAAEKDAADRRARAAVLAKEQAEAMRDRMMRMAELEARKDALSVKREVIDQVFSDALGRICNMPDDKKRNFLMKQLLSAARGGEEIIPDKKDARLFDERFMREAAERLKAQGRPGVLLSRETRDLGGGFVLKSGGMEVDLSYGAALREERPLLEAEVAKTLFNE